jgi:hypothetical protein
MDKDTKYFLESRLNPVLEHIPPDDCGQCCHESIMSEVAQEYLDQNNYVDLQTYFKEVDARWQNTPLYKRVKALQDRGMSLTEISALLEEQGILI